MPRPKSTASKPTKTKRASHRKNTLRAEFGVAAKALGEALAALATEQGVTKQYLSEHYNVPVLTVNRIFTGAASNINYYLGVAAALGMDLSLTPAKEKHDKVETTAPKAKRRTPKVKEPEEEEEAEIEEPEDGEEEDEGPDGGGDDSGEEDEDYEEDEGDDEEDEEEEVDEDDDIVF